MYNPGTNQDFFSLTSSFANPTGHVKVRLIHQDLARGVKRLSEEAYCPNWGSTSTSLRFMNALLSIFGNLNVVRAELRYSEAKHFTLVLKTIYDQEIIFKGVSGGYYGEGSRGGYDILKACGFSPKQLERIWTNEKFVITRRPKSQTYLNIQN